METIRECRQSNTAVCGDLYAYTLAIKPDELTQDKIQEEKQFFFNNEEDRLDHSFISVADFTIKEAMEETLIRWLHRIVSSTNGFTVTLNNYGVFPGESIYLRVQDHTPIQKLVKQVKALEPYIKSDNGNDLDTCIRPHLPVLSASETVEYDNAVHVYAQRVFHESFSVQELVLLKQEAGKLKRVNVFKMLPE